MWKKVVMAHLKVSKCLLQHVHRGSEVNCDNPCKGSLLLDKESNPGTPGY